MYTHWACFDCRKSFSKEASETPRKCPDCAKPMTDMGPYFEPPRKAAVKRWQVMKLLAGNDLRFNSKDAKNFIDDRILIVTNPRINDVIERIGEMGNCELKRRDYESE
jgi:hypothetical protein